MSLEFILDFETLGQSVFTAPIVNCAYYLFDRSRFTSDNPYTFNELVKEIKISKFNIKDQLDRGYKYFKRDYQWWEDKGPEVVKQLLPTNNDLTTDQFIDILNQYIPKKIDYWWSRSNSFDPVLLQRIFDDEGVDLNNTLPFWKVRDIRTYLDTRFEFKLKRNTFCPIEDEELWKKHFIAHNPRHDVAADILRMQRVERALHE